jgi:hypothetical protein
MREYGLFAGTVIALAPTIGALALAFTGARRTGEFRKSLAKGEGARR